MVAPDNLVVEPLRAIRGKVGKIASEMFAMRIEMSSMRQQTSRCGLIGSRSAWGWCTKLDEPY
jgi:hypothetical protein